MGTIIIQTTVQGKMASCFPPTPPSSGVFIHFSPILRVTFSTLLHLVISPDYNQERFLCLSVFKGFKTLYGLPRLTSWVKSLYQHICKSSYSMRELLNMRLSHRSIIVAVLVGTKGPILCLFLTCQQLMILIVEMH